MPKSSVRRKPEPRRTPARASRTKRAQPARWRSALRLAWELLPLVVLLLAALAAFVLDPEAVVRLTWACVSGTFGTGVQVTGCVVLLAGAGAIAWAFWPEPEQAKPRRATARRRPRSSTSRSRGAQSETQAAVPSPSTTPPELTDAIPADMAGASEPERAAATPAQTRKPRRTPRKASQRKQGRGAVKAFAE